MIDQFQPVNRKVWKAPGNKMAQQEQIIFVEHPIKKEAGRYQTRKLR